MPSTEAVLEDWFCTSIFYSFPFFEENLDFLSVLSQ